MTQQNSDGGEEYTDAETAKRRDEVIRRMANTPPQPRVNSPARRSGKKKTTGPDRKPREADKSHA